MSFLGCPESSLVSMARLLRVVGVPVVTANALHHEDLERTEGVYTHYSQW